VVVEIHQRTVGDQVFTPAVSAGKQEWDITDLLSKDIDCPIDPNDLLVGVGKAGTGVVEGVAGEPGLQGGIEGFSNFEFRISIGKCLKMSDLQKGRDKTKGTGTV